MESELVAESVKQGHERWIKGEGKKGARKETTMRKFTFEVSGVDNILKLKSDDFKDNWDKLK